MKKVLYVRLDVTKHRLLSALVAGTGSTLSEVVEQMIDQLLFQASAEYEAPAWLLDAVASGELPISRYGEDDDEEESGVLNWAGHA